MDTRLSYEVESSLLPEVLRSSFERSFADQETEEFLADCRRSPASYFKLFLESFMSLAMPAYEIHGLLGIYPMHLLSRAQWSVLMGGAHGTLLDVGAGQGFVTEKAKSLFEKIHTTETSHSMVKKLRDMGFECSEVDLGETTLEGVNFDAISILNVLDRCERPVSLLRNCLGMLKPGGLIMIATPLPLNPYIRKAFLNRKPAEVLPRISGSFEECLIHFHENVIQKNGLRVIRWTRLPYLYKTFAPICAEGLDDVVIVCERAS